MLEDPAFFDALQSAMLDEAQLFNDLDEWLGKDEDATITDAFATIADFEQQFMYAQREQGAASAQVPALPPQQPTTNLAGHDLGRSPFSLQYGSAQRAGAAAVSSSSFALAQGPSWGHPPAPAPGPDLGRQSFSSAASTDPAPSAGSGLTPSTAATAASPALSEAGLSGAGSRPGQGPQHDLPPLSSAAPPGGLGGLLAHRAVVTQMQVQVQVPPPLDTSRASTGSAPLYSPAGPSPAAASAHHQHALQSAAPWQRQQQQQPNAIPSLGDLLSLAVTGRPQGQQQQQ